MRTLINTYKKAVFLLSLLFIMQACSSVRPTPFRTSDSVKPPAGAVDLLQNRPEKMNELNFVSTSDAAAEPGIEVEIVLQDVLEELLDRFDNISDFEQYGKFEYWATPSESSHTNSFNDDYYITGDCDEFALHAWKELRRRGIKARLVAARTEEGTSHLVVESEGWILDNRLPYVVANTELNYQWESISGYDMKDQWSKIDTNSFHETETLMASTKK